MVVTHVIVPPPGWKKPTDRKRAIMEWKGVRFVRSHSFLFAVEQIVQRAKNNDVIKIGIVGEMGTGKTTLAQAIAHAFHARMKDKHGIPFAVRFFGARELADLDGTLNDLPPANYVIGFDDVSFMDANTSGRRIAAVKNTLTTIRHRASGDVKFLIIYGYHYSKGLDKFLRQSDFKFYTSIGDEEVEYMENMYRANNKHITNIVQTFRAQYNSATDTDVWRSRYGREGTHTYRYRDPFIPVLFTATGGRMRPIIGPTREFLAPHCHICTVSEHVENAIDPATFRAEGENAFGRTTFGAAMKLIALENGIFAHPQSVLNCKRAIEASLSSRRVNLVELLRDMGMARPPRPHKRASHDRFVAAIRAAPGCPADVKKAPPGKKAKRAGAAAPGRAQNRKPVSPPPAAA